MPRLKPLIVISDDEETFVDLYEAILLKNGFRCISIPNKKTLLDLIGAIKPDLVITDIGSPGENGLRFLESLRARNDVKAIPVIVVSVEQEYTGRALALGVKDFIAKPFEIEMFVKSVTSALVQSPWPEDSN